MTNFVICAHRRDGVWFARDNCMEFDLKGEGESAASAVIALLLQLGEDRYLIDELKLIHGQDEHDEILLFFVPALSRSKIPMPSVNCALPTAAPFMA